MSKKDQCLARVVKTIRSPRAGFLGTGLLMLLPLLATGCGTHANASAAAEGEAKPEATSIDVAVINPVRKDLTREIDQPGYLRPYEETPIYTKIAGFAMEPKVDINDRVKKGDLLLQVYVPEVEQDLNVKVAKVLQAKADLKQAKEAALAAKANVEAVRADIEAKRATIRSNEAQVMRWQAEDARSRRLLEKGIYDQQTADEVFSQLRASEASRDEAKANLISTQAKLDQASAQFNKAEADVEVAAAMVTVAEATRDQWRDWLAYSKITAPYDGIITSLRVHTGHFLQPANSGTTNKSAEPLFVMMRTDIMRCTVDVPELDAPLVQPHDKATISLQARPGTEILGEVTRFSYSLDEHSRTLRVECHLPNPDGTLLPGMYANVTIKAKMKNVWTLPADAIMNDILKDGDRRYCFVVEDGKAHKLFLKVGPICDEGVQIISKQKAGATSWQPITGKEAVIVTNPKALQDDQPVKLQTAATH